MKSITLISVVSAACLAALCGCTKTMPYENANSHEIKFLAAKYVTKADENPGSGEFTGASFGVYSWNTAGGDEYFMDNALITKQADETTGESYWKPVQTYYWPTDGKLDFVSYYPYVESSSYLTAEKDKLSYTDFNVIDNQIDLMYSDKAVGYTYKESESGVPAIFNHALSRVRVLIAKPYASKTNVEGDGSTTVTRWVVRVNSAEIVDLDCVSSAEFTITEQKEFGTVSWTKPVRSREVAGKQTDFNVWAAGSERYSKQLSIPEGGLELQVLSRDGDGNVTGGFSDVLPYTFVIPQMLDEGRQGLKLNYTIETYQTVGGVESLFNTETYDKQVDFRIASSLEAWQINQSITYYIMIAPTRGQGFGGGNPGDPLDPNYPVNPDDPDLSDVSITFDPVLDGWDNLSVAAVMGV